MKNIFVALGALLLATSCSSDFLDKEPLGVLSETTLSTDSVIMGQAVNRIYASLNWREYGIGRQQFSTHEMCGDDYLGIDGTLATYNNFTYAVSDGYFQQYWDRTYQNIHYCNEVIDRIPSMQKIAPYSANLYEAQTKFFRAYYNFDLTNVFGDAPLRDHDPIPSEYNIPKSTHADIVKLVISDLKFAIDHLPTRSQWGTSNLGRVTKGTAQGLLAKVYLYEKDYANAKKYAEDVIAPANSTPEYSLYSSYRNLFSPDNRYSSENMMPTAFIYNTSVWSGRWYSPYLQWQGLPDLGGNGLLYPSSSLVNEYESGDPRRVATIFEKGVNDVIVGFTSKTTGTSTPAWPTTTRYANNKIIWPYSYWNAGNFNFTNVSPMLFRFADVVLIAAEANNELGNAGLALGYLENIRYRARGNKTFDQSVAAGENNGAGILPKITTTNKAQLRLAIWHERRVELALEFNRWFDLVRYNNVANADGSDGSGYTENLIKNVYGKTNFNYAKYSHFPIPLTYITSSGGVLVQNDAWK